MTVLDSSISIQPIPKNHRLRDLTGQSFGRFLVLGFVGKNARGASLWLCRCECGNQFIHRGDRITNGEKQSCGCLFRELASQRAKTHGLSKTSEYASWNKMISRCINPKNDAFDEYAGRGITVCERWLTFENFLADMGNKTSPGLSIERIDNNLGYCPENCKWGTRIEQANNRRSTRFLTFHGKTQSVGSWARERGFRTHIIFGRLRLGWSVERTLTEPVHHNIKN